MRPGKPCTCPEAAVPHEHNYAHRCNQPDQHDEPGMILCIEQEHWNDANAREAELDALVGKEVSVVNRIDRHNGDPQVQWEIAGELRCHADRDGDWPAFYNVETGQNHETSVVFTAEHIQELDVEHLRLELE